MFSLECIKQLNQQAVAEHDPSLLNEQWPDGETQFVEDGAAGPPSIPPSKKSKRTIFLTPEATVEYAEVIGGHDFAALRRGIKAVRLTDGEEVTDEAAEPDAMTIYLFTLATAPDLVATWTEALQAKVARYEDWPVSSFTILDRVHSARILIRHNCIVGVTRIHRRRKSQ